MYQSDCNELSPPVMEVTPCTGDAIIVSHQFMSYNFLSGIYMENCMYRHQFNGTFSIRFWRQVIFFFETQAELANLVNLPNLANLPNSVKINSLLNKSKFKFKNLISL